MAEPWERQEKESDKAFEAFVKYRDMGLDRSTTKVAKELAKSEQLIRRWSATYDWVKRAAAWDNEVDKDVQKAQRQEITEMRKRHATLASAMLVKAAKALQAIPEDEIKASDISRMVDVASKLERVSRGDVGEVIEERDGGQAIPAVQIYVPTNNRERGKDTFEDLEV